MAEESNWFDDFSSGYDPNEPQLEMPQAHKDFLTARGWTPREEREGYNSAPHFTKRTPGGLTHSLFWDGKRAWQDDKPVYQLETSLPDKGKSFRSIRSDGDVVFESDNPGAIEAKAKENERLWMTGEPGNRGMNPGLLKFMDPDNAEYDRRHWVQPTDESPAPAGFKPFVEPKEKLHPNWRGGPEGRSGLHRLNGANPVKAHLPWADLVGLTPEQSAFQRTHPVVRHQVLSWLADMGHKQAFNSLIGVHRAQTQVDALRARQGRRSPYAHPALGQPYLNPSDSTMRMRAVAAAIPDESGLKAAGIAVIAMDTGRVLMQQRALNPMMCPCGMGVTWDEMNGYQHDDGSVSHDGEFYGSSVSDLLDQGHPEEDDSEGGDDGGSDLDEDGLDKTAALEFDPNEGTWEFPGGKLDEGESPRAAAAREFREEVGQDLPPGVFVGAWVSPGGISVAAAGVEKEAVARGGDQGTSPGFADLGWRPAGEDSWTLDDPQTGTRHAADRDGEEWYLTSTAPEGWEALPWQTHMHQPEVARQVQDATQYRESTHMTPAEVHQQAKINAASYGGLGERAVHNLVPKKSPYMMSPENPSGKFNEFIPYVEPDDHDPMKRLNAAGQTPAQIAAQKWLDANPDQFTYWQSSPDASTGRFDPVNQQELTPDTERQQEWQHNNHRLEQHGFRYVAPANPTQAGFYYRDSASSPGMGQRLTEPSSWEPYWKIHQGPARSFGHSDFAVGMHPNLEDAIMNADHQEGRLSRQAASEFRLPKAPVYRQRHEVDPRALDDEAAMHLYNALQHEPYHPEVQHSYDALERETLGQWNDLRDAGLQVHFHDGFGGNRDYPNSAAMVDDAHQGQLWTRHSALDGMSPDHPMARHMGFDVPVQTGEGVEYKPATLNDIFRAVHDVNGHAAGLGHEVVGFGPKGEFNAWLRHRTTYSDDALPALWNETRGQAAQLGPMTQQGIPLKEIPFLDQKAGAPPRHMASRSALDGMCVTPGRGQGMVREAADLPQRSPLAEPPDEHKLALVNAGWNPKQAWEEGMPESHKLKADFTKTSPGTGITHNVSWNGREGKWMYDATVPHWDEDKFRETRRSVNPNDPRRNLNGMGNIPLADPAEVEKARKHSERSYVVGNPEHGEPGISHLFNDRSKFEHRWGDDDNPDYTPDTAAVTQRSEPAFERKREGDPWRGTHPEPDVGYMPYYIPNPGESWIEGLHNFDALEQPPHQNPFGGLEKLNARKGPVYKGFIYLIQKESDIDLGNREIANPDDPDGDMSEQSAWWEIDHAKKNPALRKEVKTGTPWADLALWADKSVRTNKGIKEALAKLAAGFLDEVEDHRPTLHGGLQYHDHPMSPYQSIDNDDYYRYRDPEFVPPLNEDEINRGYQVGDNESHRRSVDAQPMIIPKDQSDYETPEAFENSMGRTKTTVDWNDPICEHCYLKYGHTVPAATHMWALDKQYNDLGEPKHEFKPMVPTTDARGNFRESAAKEAMPMTQTEPYVTGIEGSGEGALNRKVTLPSGNWLAKTPKMTNDEGDEFDEDEEDPDWVHDRQNEIVDMEEFASRLGRSISNPDDEPLTPEVIRGNKASDPGPTAYIRRYPEHREMDHGWLDYDDLEHHVNSQRGQQHGYLHSILGDGDKLDHHNMLLLGDPMETQSEKIRAMPTVSIDHTRTTLPAYAETRNENSEEYDPDYAKQLRFAHPNGEASDYAEKHFVNRVRNTTVPKPNPLAPGDTERAVAASETMRPWAKQRGREDWLDAAQDRVRGYGEHASGIESMFPYQMAHERAQRVAAVKKKAVTWIDRGPSTGCEFGCPVQQMKLLDQTQPVQGEMVDHTGHGGRIRWKVTVDGQAKEQGKARHKSWAEKDMLDAYGRVAGSMQHTATPRPATAVWPAIRQLVSAGRPGFSIRTPAEVAGEHHDMIVDNRSPEYHEERAANLDTPKIYAARSPGTRSTTFLVPLKHDQSGQTGWVRGRTDQQPNQWKMYRDSEIVDAVNGRNPKRAPKPKEPTQRVPSKPRPVPAEQRYIRQRATGKPPAQPAESAPMEGDVPLDEEGHQIVTPRRDYITEPQGRYPWDFDWDQPGEHPLRVRDDDWWKAPA